MILEARWKIPVALLDVPVTMHHVFSVTASGTYTYYILAQEDIGDFRVYDNKLTLIFVPTAYGGVTLAAAGVSSVTSDVAAERAATEAANTARLDREIAELRAQIQEPRAAVPSPRVDSRRPSRSSSRARSGSRAA